MFNYNDWLEEIYDCLDQEIGSDDIIHGNYVEWDLFRKYNEENLLSSFGLEFPWGESITEDKYNKLIDELPKICVEYLNNEMVRTPNGEILFIERDSEAADLIVTEILDLNNVPSGTDYEVDLPEKFKYWRN